LPAHNPYSILYYGDSKMTVTTQKETLGFQTEVKQLLQLMIHSLYSNKEIFLRELVSNASDAADKLRFEAVSDNALYGDDSALKIRIALDKAARTITISDNGIGMSRDEVIANIGTIARSGTREFFKSLTGDAARDANLIGQFGVGFYSSFIVADKVTLVTRRAGLPAGQAVRWESDGGGEFSIEPVSKETRGTDVILHLKEGEDDLLDAWRLKSIVKRYSDHIPVPIVMKKQEWDKDKGEQVETGEDETINQASALWARPKADVTEEQYQEFFQHISHGLGKPLAWTHSKVEGRHEYTLLLYIPEQAPFDVWDRSHRHGIRLYVRRVFILDDAEQLMPNYLRFVRGVIDSNDLPLNVSREILQESRDVKAIREGSVKKVLGMIEDLAENQQDKFVIFWKQFGAIFKEGIGEDHQNQERIAALCRFATTLADSADQTVSLADYISRMKEGQEAIYYVTAESFTAAKNSPHLEVFRKKGIEVLLLSERVDEFWLGAMQEFQGKTLQSVARGDLDLGKLEDEAEKQAHEKEAQDFKDLVGRVKEVLGERVKEVRITHRLTDSPACLVVDENEFSGNLVRMLKSVGQAAPVSKPIFELNPAHPLVARLKAAAPDEGSRFADWSLILFDQAQLAEGGQLEDPASFVRRLNTLLLEMPAK
jgi:molecular chaperone HtpG